MSGFSSSFSTQALMERSGGGEVKPSSGAGELRWSAGLEQTANSLYSGPVLPPFTPDYSALYPAQPYPSLAFSDSLVASTNSLLQSSASLPSGSHNSDVREVLMSD